VILEERVYDEKGEFVYFTKLPMVSEEELVKMKKQKSKNLNPNDLNPVLMRAWFDLSDFEVPGTIESTKRCVVEQVRRDYLENKRAERDYFLNSQHFKMLK